MTNDEIKSLRQPPLGDVDLFDKFRKLHLAALRLIGELEEEKTTNHIVLMDIKHQAGDALAAIVEAIDVPPNAHVEALRQRTRRQQTERVVAGLSAITGGRMTEMGMTPFALAETLGVVRAQSCEDD